MQFPCGILIKKTRFNFDKGTLVTMATCTLWRDSVGAYSKYGKCFCLDPVPMLLTSMTSVHNMKEST